MVGIVGVVENSVKWWKMGYVLKTEFLLPNFEREAALKNSAF